MTIFYNHQYVFFKPLLEWKSSCVCYKLKNEKVKTQNIKHVIGIKVTFLLEIKLQKYFCLAKYDHFSVVIFPFWTSIRKGMCMQMPGLKQLEKNAFKINSQNINQEICLQVTFTLEMKLQKYIFFRKIWQFF